jgi:hypothetical protein
LLSLPTSLYLSFFSLLIEEFCHFMLFHFLNDGSNRSCFEYCLPPSAPI